MSNLHTQQQSIQKIMWGSLLFSNCVFFYLVYTDMIGTKNLQESNEIIAKVPYFMAVILGTASFMIFRSTKNQEKLKKQLEKIKIGGPSNIQMTSAQIEEFNNMSDADKKKYILRNNIFIKYIISWALAESVNIFGLIGPFLGMPRNHYYTFFAVAIGLMLTSFPSKNESIDRF